MNKLFYAIILSAALTFSASGALLINNGGGATNITATSAWPTATIVSTGAANPYLYIYWGTNDGSTNASSWENTNSIGSVTQDSYSVQVTNLSSFQIYYHRAFATNSLTTNWAAYSAQFITLFVSTSAPISSTRAVSVDLYGMLKNPTNFWTTNIVGLAAALSSYGFATDAYTKAESDAKYATTGTVGSVSNDVEAIKDRTNVYEQAAIDASSYTSSVAATITSGMTNDWTLALDYTNYAFIAWGWGDWATNYLNWDMITNTPATLTGYGIADAYTKVESDGLFATGTPVYVEADPVWESEKAGYATGTPLYVETYLGTITSATIAAGSSDSVTTNDGDLAFTWNTNAAGGGAGSGFPLDADGDLAGYTLSNGVLSNVTFYGNGIGMTNVPGTETGRVSFGGESNVVMRVDGTNVYFGAPDLALKSTVTIVSNAAIAYADSVGTVVSNAALAYADSVGTVVSNASDAGDVVVSNAALAYADSVGTVVSNAAIAADLVVSNAYTNTKALAAAALPKSGGTMTGALTNDVAYWLPANGIVYFGTSTNYIKDQDGTNFLFMSGTNSANFGW